MTRYSVQVGRRWLAAAYDNGSGLLLTTRQDDACSWVLVERACEAARVASAFFKIPAVVEAVEEPVFPRSWTARAT